MSACGSAWPDPVCVCACVRERGRKREICKTSDYRKQFRISSTAQGFDAGIAGAAMA